MCHSGQRVTGQRSRDNWCGECVGGDKGKKGGREGVRVLWVLKGEEEGKEARGERWDKERVKGGGNKERRRKGKKLINDEWKE